LNKFILYIFLIFFFFNEKKIFAADEKLLKQIETYLNQFD